MFNNNYAYLNTADIEEIFEKVKGSRKGITPFLRDAKEIASKTRNGKYVYKDETALFIVLEKHIGKELQQRGIDCFGRLMQYIS